MKKLRAYQLSRREIEEEYNHYTDAVHPRVFSAGGVVIDRDHFVRWYVEVGAPFRYTIEWFTPSDAGDWTTETDLRDPIRATQDAAAEAKQVARAIERDGKPDRAIMDLGVEMEGPPVREQDA